MRPLDLSAPRAASGGATVAVDSAISAANNNNNIAVAGNSIGTRVLCPRAQCAGLKRYYKTVTLLPYSESIGVFNVGIGCFSIRLAE